MPKVVLVWLKGKVPHGVGPHDIAIAICGAVFKNGFVKNAVLEFGGPGIADIELAMKAGYSTATDNVRSLGFGAGMGLPNMKRYTDSMEIESVVGKGTTITMTVNVK